MKALFLVHNHPNRGSWFRALEIARRVAQRGHTVQFAFTSDTRKYRPAYMPANSGELSPWPDPSLASSAVRDRLPLRNVVPGKNFIWAEMPYRTLFNERQEGWSVFDNFVRLRDALSERWELVYGFSHKPVCVLPGLMAQMRGAKYLLDWSDWWGTDEGLFSRCVIPSQGFQALPFPLRFARRAVFGIEGWREPLAYRKPDAVTLISEEFFHHPRAPKDLSSRALVMHSGSDLEHIRPQTKAGSRNAIGLDVPDDAVVFGYIANFHMAERLLLEAFARVRQEIPNAVLLVVGAGLEQSTPEIHALTAGGIRHYGWQPFTRISQFLGASDVLVLPLNNIALDRARYPHKLSDYVAAGRPIVACDVGETGRLLKRYNFGRLCTPDSANLSATMIRAAKERATWEDEGNQVRSAAESHFDWNDIFERWREFVTDRTGLAL